MSAYTPIVNVKTQEMTIRYELTEVSKRRGKGFAD